ncbi:unnamed protein product [Schistosoma mattheei]|uniref:Uncharacterized protein n=1 Tax=Schistosoma mattheei TaxID=31246 RepID=A0A183P9E2_9TREM|nr:unnamed protein product [Schistosoma mattheei]
MKDVRTRRKVDIASDHHQPVEFKIKQKIKKHWTIRKTALKRFNTDFHRHTDKPNQFKITLNNRFHVLQDILGGEEEEETNMEDNWRGIKEASTSTCQEMLGRKKHHYKEWISIDTVDEIQERKNNESAINDNRTRTEHVKTRTDYTESSKQVEKIVRDIIVLFHHVLTMFEVVA